MRLCALMLTCFFSFTNSYGQDYNMMYPYAISSSYAEVHAVDVIADANGNTIHLSSGVNDELILTKLDFNGGLVWNEAHDIVGSNYLTSIQPYKIIETLNGDFIVVGFAYTTLYAPKNPFAAKFDATGTFLDFQIYNSNMSGSMYNVPGFTRVNIERMQNTNTGTEDYIITAPGTSPLSPYIIPGSVPPSNYQDCAINAISIDQGTLLPYWNHKYFVANTMAARTGWASGNPLYTPGTMHVNMHRDHPQGLTHVLDGTTDKYVITGTAYEGVWPFGGGVSSFNHYNFVMSVDNSGNVVNGYSGEYTFNYPFGHNMIWDQGTNEVVMSFTIGNTNLASSGTPASTTPASVIAIMKLNPSTLAVVGGSSDYYYMLNGVENYAYGLIENQAKNGYVIGCYFSDYQTVPGSYYDNISLLEVDKTTMNVNYYNRFNIDAQTYPAATAYNEFAGTANYVVTGEKHNGVGVSDLRSLSADISGSTCGVFSDAYGQGTVSHGSENTPPTFVVHAMPKTADQENLNALNELTRPDDCKASMNPNAWKTTSVNDLTKEASVKVFPSVITQNNEALNIAIDANYAGNISAGIYSIDGRKVAEKNYTVNEGTNNLIWHVTLPASGNYILKINATDAELNHTARITKL